MWPGGVRGGGRRADTAHFCELTKAFENVFVDFFSRVTTLIFITFTLDFRYSRHSSFGF